MVKFYKNAKGHFFIDTRKVGKVEFLSEMIDSGRKYYVKESKKGNNYYYSILETERSFMITAKVKIPKYKEAFYSWDFIVYSQKRGTKPATETQFYAVESKCNFAVYEDYQFNEEQIKEFNVLLKEMLDFVKKKYSLVDVYCRGIVSVIYTLEPKEENDEEPTSFERKYSSKGYEYEESLEEIFIDLINKMLFGQSIVKITFTHINLLCT